MAHSSKKDDCDIQQNSRLSSESSQYEVLGIIGSGSYGKVARCLKVGTPEEVAVKLMKNDRYYNLVDEKEVDILKRLNDLNLNKNFVHFFEVFYDKQHICLVFEMLDRPLDRLMLDRSHKPLPLPEIRVITKQLLLGLDALKGLGLIHTDIKPDNIMLVNHESRPFVVKLIDFGLAMPISSAANDKKVQALGYRAPEVILGAKWSEPIDMWGLGCVTAFLYISCHLYPTRCEYETMRIIMQMQGQPDNQLLNDGLKTHRFFTKTGGSVDAGWRLKTKEEYKLATGLSAGKCHSISRCFTCLDDMVKIHTAAVKNDTMDEDTDAFFSLLKQMLCVDPKKRITPSEALKHCFITMTHFPDDTTNPYVTSSRLIMEVCQEAPRELTTNETLKSTDGSKDAAGSRNGSASVNHKPSVKLTNKPTASERVHSGQVQVNKRPNEGSSEVTAVKCMKPDLRSGEISKMMKKLWWCCCETSVED